MVYVSVQCGSKQLKKVYGPKRPVCVEKFCYDKLTNFVTTLIYVQTSLYIDNIIHINGIAHTHSYAFMFIITFTHARTHSVPANGLPYI